MTRKLIYRTLIATLLLPNFAAYWRMLPRRMKRIRTQRDLRRHLEAIEMGRLFAAEVDRHRKFMEYLSSGKVERISAGEFRVPFQVRAAVTGTVI